mgnify:CR=1 FL=1
MTARTLTLGGATYPLILPNLRDPRLHVAAVIITIHVLGQVGLGFRVTIPQVLAAIVTSAILEIAITFRQSRAFVWPASAMLTGSGVALIMRVVGTPPDDPWNTYAWFVFAAVAGLSLLSKYVIRYRGSHVFNPSNIGLVVAFVVLGSARAEPLDFWWAPLNAWLLAAYAAITVGGILITRRLRLLGLAAAFWITLAAGLGVLAASGHCMTARWAFAPVCGADYWRVIVTSPEVLIFLFFMITDPKTVPTGAVGRIVFGVLVALTSTLLMAPQTDEFGTKVALLSGLVAVCAVRPLLDRVLPVPGSAGDHPSRLAIRLVRGDPAAGFARGTAGVALTGAAVLGIGAGVVVAGIPARGVIAYNAAEVLGRVPYQVDPATLPAITVDVDAWDETMAVPIAQEILLALAEDLELENQALLRRDGSILPAADHGDRLEEMERRLAEARASGRTTIARYTFDSVHVVVIAPFGVQTGGSIGLQSRGTLTEETYDASGALVDRRSEPFEQTFAMRRPTGDRWLIVGAFPNGADG